jgi:hypothetical protein
MDGISMKIYGVSATRNGTITNANYNNLSYTGVDSNTGKQYHLWYPVEIPEGTNSLFSAVTTGVVDQISVPYSAGAENNSQSLLQERMILIHNDSNTSINTVNIFIADQQLTGCVAEITPWKATGTTEIHKYSDFEVLTSSNPAVNFSQQYAYIKANFQGSTPEPETLPAKNIIITNMAAWGWYVAALRIYGSKDQAVEEDYCIIATESL